MLIRRISPGDFEGVRALFIQVHALHVEARPDIYADADPFTREDFGALLASERSFALVAEEGGVLIGFTAVTLREPSKDKRINPRSVAHMDDLCVDSARRERGVGKALFEAAKAEAASRGAKRLELMVWEFNDRAIRFYKELGMSVRSEILEISLS